MLPLQVHRAVAQVSPAAPYMATGPKDPLHGLGEDVPVFALTLAVAHRVLRHDGPVGQREGEAGVVEAGIGKVERVTPCMMPKHYHSIKQGVCPYSNIAIMKKVKVADLSHLDSDLFLPMHVTDSNICRVSFLQF